MLRIGIIGTGRRAGGHICGIENVKDAVITAICDIDKEALNTTGDRLGIPQKYRFTDYNDLINCSEVDAVEICTPNYLHVPMAAAAARAGKPVEIEKPLSTEYKEDIDELLNIIKEKNLTNMMCFSYRFTPAVRYAKHLIENKRLGKIINVNIEYLQSGVFIKDRRLEWRFVKEFAGSGALADLGVHLIDLTRFLLGDFKSVYAMMNTVVKERMKLDCDEYAAVTVDDITSFVARLENDIITNFLVTKCAIGERNTIKYEIYGTEGVIKFNLNNPDIIDLCIGDIDKETGCIHTVNVPDEYYLEEEECFTDAIKGKNHCYFPSVADGAKAQKVVDAILKSAEENTIINL